MFEKYVNEDLTTPPNPPLWVTGWVCDNTGKPLPDGSRVVAVIPGKRTLDGNYYVRSECILEARTEQQVSDLLEKQLLPSQPWWRPANKEMQNRAKLVLSNFIRTHMSYPHAVDVGPIGDLPTDSNLFMAIPNEGVRSYEMGREISFYYVDDNDTWWKMDFTTTTQSADIIRQDMKVLEEQPEPPKPPVTPPPSGDEPLTAQKAVEKAIALLQQALPQMSTIGAPIQYTEDSMVWNKLRPFSLVSCNEFITPLNPAVVDIALRVDTTKTIVEQCEQIFNLTCAKIDYLWDSWMYYGADVWQFPAQTLAFDPEGRSNGDCEDATFAYVSVARALNLPVRAVVGTVTVGGNSAGHAWAEVEVDGAWWVIECTHTEWPSLQPPTFTTTDTTGNDLTVTYRGMYWFNEREFRYI